MIFMFSKQNTLGNPSMFESYHQVDRIHFLLLLASPLCIWDLSSPTRFQTQNRFREIWELRPLTHPLYLGKP